MNSLPKMPKNIKSVFKAHQPYSKHSSANGFNWDLNEKRKNFNLLSVIKRY